MWVWVWGGGGGGGGYPFFIHINVFDIGSDAVIFHTKGRESGRSGLETDTLARGNCPQDTYLRRYDSNLTHPHDVSVVIPTVLLPHLTYPPKNKYPIGCHCVLVNLTYDAYSRSQIIGTLFTSFLLGIL